MRGPSTHRRAQPVSSAMIQACSDQCRTGSQAISSGNKKQAGYQREAEVTLSVFEALNDTHPEHPLSALLGTRVMGWLMVKL